MWWQGLHPESTPGQTWGLSHWEPDAGLRLSDNPSHTSAEEAVMVCVWCVWCGMCGVCVCARVSQAHWELPCPAWARPTQPPWNVGGCSGQAQTSPSVCAVPLLQGTGPCTHRTLHAHFNGPEPVRSHATDSPEDVLLLETSPLSPCGVLSLLPLGQGSMVSLGQQVRNRTH